MLVLNVQFDANTAWFGRCVRVGGAHPVEVAELFILVQCNVYVWFCIKHLYRVKHTVCICQMSDAESVLQTINGKILKRVAKRKVVFACGILQCHLYLWCKYQIFLCLIFLRQMSLSDPDIFFRACVKLHIQPALLCSTPCPWYTVILCWRRGRAQAVNVFLTLAAL